MEITKYYLKNLSLARKSAKQSIKYETDCLDKNLKPWTFYDSGIDKYQFRFRHLLTERGFINLVNKKDQVALDTFSSLSFIRELASKAKNLKGGISLSLVDFRSDQQKYSDSSRNIFQLVKSDVFNSKEWMGEVKNFLQNNGKEKFDLITCLPQAGWIMKNENGKDINPPIKLLWTVTNTLWQLLANDGSMFIEYPYGYYTDVFYWINRAAKKCNLEFSSDDKSIAVRIDKKGSKLKQFPFI